MPWQGNAVRVIQAIAMAFVISALDGEIPALANDRPPNVVLIIGDDQAWTDYGFMGHDTIKTPNLDRLASESALSLSMICRKSSPR